MSLSQPAEMQTCTRCVLNTADTPNITFDAAGVCNYCNGYDATIRRFNSDPQSPEARLQEMVKAMKKAGARGKYDCILGLSGGTDSSYMAWWAHQQGLRPLVVHLDNGWNSELAVKNIENICLKLGWDLHTHVINWEEFRDLQLAYMRASVVDIEVLTDHAIYAVVYELAKKYGVRYTLNGYNYATEAIMPKGWTFNKRDYTNIRDIWEHHGSGRKLRTFPRVPFFKALWYHWFLRLESIYVLNYLPFNKSEAKEIITRELDWRDYGGKHFESVFTKFYQIYILPRKFGIDKRKAHLSNLICSGQITREQALAELQQPLYDPAEMEEELQFILKKFNLSAAEFEAIMQTPVRRHEDYKTDQHYWNRYFAVLRFLKWPLRLIGKGR